ncbi:TetR/AcrR family transcriptional regulator [Kribbella speibonae]|uniref:TetR family transcriptional regulator n=1 Tax=Kribbella speibonae TaxID=1572660 RepID=A0A4R0IRJ4_9ACTN|nr:TetR family transcriptional regulator [Kribbella speibonae]TCC36411.1 TetR family transcriptional regulator [Kribbella speibonae]
MDKQRLRKPAKGEPTSRRRGRPTATTPLEIQRVAVRLFDTRGYTQTSIDDIAESAGIGRTSYFRYFRSKSSVVWYDFRAARERLRPALAQAHPDDDPMDVVRAALVDSIVYTEDDVEFLRTRDHLLENNVELFKEAAAHSLGTAQVLADYLRSRFTRGDTLILPEAIGYSFVGALAAAIHLWVTDPRLDLHGLLKAAVQTVEVHGGRPVALLNQAADAGVRQLGPMVVPTAIIDGSVQLNGAALEEMA